MSTWTADSSQRFTQFTHAKRSFAGRDSRVTNRTSTQGTPGCIVPSLHGSQTPWVQLEYLQEKYLWMSLAKHGCTTCTMFSHKLSYVNKRQAIEGSSRMRSKGSHVTLGISGGWGCVRQTLCNRSQPGCTCFFSGLPGLSGSVPLPLLHEVPRKFSWILRCSSTCPILPQCVLQMSSRAMDTEICCHGLHMSWCNIQVLKELRIETM